MDLGERDHRPRQTSAEFGTWGSCGGGVPGALVIQATKGCPRGMQDHIELRRAGFHGPFRLLAISELRHHRVPLGPWRRCDSVRGYVLARRAWRSGERDNWLVDRVISKLRKVPQAVVPGHQRYNRPPVL